MPDRSFKVGEDIYDIPENQVEEFLQEFPNAQEIQTFTSGQDTFDIPIDLVPEFTQEFPDAKPVGREEKTEVGSPETTDSSLFEPTLSGEQTEFQQQTSTVADIEEKPKTVKERAKTFVDDLATGSEMLGGMLARTPAFLYDLMVAPQNFIAKNVEGAEFLLAPNSKQLAEQLGLPDNKIAEYYENQVAESQKEFNEEFDKSLVDYLGFGEDSGDRDLNKFISSLTRQITRSAPTTIGLMAANAAGVGVAGTTLGGAAVFGAGEFEELKEAGLSDENAAFTAGMKGFYEGFFESFGITKLGGMWRDIAERSGKEAADAAIQRIAKEGYAPVLRKYGIIAAEESAGEAFTQLAQNFQDKFSGAKPDLNILDGVADAAMIGLGASQFYSSGPLAKDVAITRKAKNAVSRLEEERNRLDTDISSGNVLGAASQAVFNERDEVTEEILEIVDSEKAQFDELSQEDKDQVVELRNRRNDLETSLGRTDISEESKSALESELKEVDRDLKDIIDVAKKEKKKQEALPSRGEQAAQDEGGETVEGAEVGDSFQRVPKEQRQEIVNPVIEVGEKNIPITQVEDKFFRVKKDGTPSEQEIKNETLIEEYNQKTQEQKAQTEQVEETQPQEEKLSLGELKRRQRSTRKEINDLKKRKQQVEQEFNTPQIDDMLVDFTPPKIRSKRNNTVELETESGTRSIPAETAQQLIQEEFTDLQNRFTKLDKLKKCR